MVKGALLVIQYTGSTLDPRAVIKTPKECYLTREQSMKVMEIAHRQLHGIKQYGGPISSQREKSGETHTKDFMIVLNVEHEPDALSRFAAEVKKTIGISVQDAGIK